MHDWIEKTDDDLRWFADVETKTLAQYERFVQDQRAIVRGVMTEMERRGLTMPNSGAPEGVMATR